MVPLGNPGNEENDIPKSVRGNAGKHITAALPRVGAVVQKYAGLSAAAADFAGLSGYRARHE